MKVVQLIALPKKSLASHHAKQLSTYALEIARMIVNVFDHVPLIPSNVLIIVLATFIAQVDALVKITNVPLVRNFTETQLLAHVLRIAILIEMNVIGNAEVMISIVCHLVSTSLIKDVSMSVRA